MHIAELVWLLTKFTGAFRSAVKNENVLNDMVDILDELHKYVPDTATMQTFDVYTEGGVQEQLTSMPQFSHIPFGGEQLTVAKIRGSQRVQFNSDERLEGFMQSKIGTQRCALWR